VLPTGTGSTAWAAPGPSPGSSATRGAGQPATSPRSLEGSQRQVGSLMTAKSTSALTWASSSARMHSPRSATRLEAAGGPLGRASAAQLVQPTGASRPAATTPGTTNGVQRMISGAGSQNTAYGLGSGGGPQWASSVVPRSARRDRSASPVPGAAQVMQRRVAKASPSNPTPSKQPCAVALARSPRSPSMTPRPTPSMKQMSSPSSSNLGSSGHQGVARGVANLWASLSGEAVATDSSWASGAAQLVVAPGPPQPSSGSHDTLIRPGRPSVLMQQGSPAATTPMVKRSKSDGSVLRE